MNDNFPKDIANGIMLFEKAFNSENHLDLVRTFKDAIYVLNDCQSDFPVYKQDINNLKYSNSVRLLCYIIASLPAPEYNLWLEFIMLFCIDLKTEISKLYSQDPSLFESFHKILTMHSDRSTSELQDNISSFLKEITS